MINLLRELYEKSDFAKENLSFNETLRELCLSLGFEFNPILPEFREEKKDRLISAFKKALSGYPLQYITGKAFFYESEFIVREGVLIPRCDSECLVEKAIERLPENSHFLDICTGSGCLAISVLKKRADTRATLIDICETALDTARENAERLGVIDRCEFLKLDILKTNLDALPKHSAIIMNPPYLTTAEMNDIPENVKYEPSLALDGGNDGLEFYKLFKNYEGLVLFEIGSTQDRALKELFPSGEVFFDLSHNPRVYIKPC